MGEPTEAALKVLAEKLGHYDTTLSRSSAFSPVERASTISVHYETLLPRLLTFEFSRDRKMMSVLVRRGNGGSLLVKGAPESVLERCTSSTLR